VGFGHDAAAGSSLFVGLVPAVVRVAVGFGAGVVAALMGVGRANCWFRRLVLLFGADMKVAGNLSLAVSLPTILAGLVLWPGQSFAVTAPEPGSLLTRMWGITWYHSNVHSYRMPAPLVEVSSSAPHAVDGAAATGNARRPVDRGIAVTAAPDIVGQEHLAATARGRIRVGAERREKIADSPISGRLSDGSSVYEHAIHGSVADIASVCWSVISSPAPTSKYRRLD